jgi:hypothetical protein
MNRRRCNRCPCPRSAVGCATPPARRWPARSTCCKRAKALGCGARAFCRFPGRRGLSERRPACRRARLRSSGRDGPYKIAGSFVDGLLPFSAYPVLRDSRDPGGLTLVVGVTDRRTGPAVLCPLAPQAAHAAGGSASMVMTSAPQCTENRPRGHHLAATVAVSTAEGRRP